MRNGVCWERPTLERVTTGSGRGYWPTPTVQDAENDGGPSQYNRNSIPLNALVKLGTNGGQLNPPWVEWLMGWPIGWTDLKPLAMDRFRQWFEQFGSY